MRESGIGYVSCQCAEPVVAADSLRLPLELHIVGRPAMSDSESVSRSRELAELIVQLLVDAGTVRRPSRKRHGFAVRLYARPKDSLALLALARAGPIDSGR